MEELINQVAQKTGISQEAAKNAVDTVLAHIKSRLPAPLASQIDSALTGGGLGEVANKIGNLIGKS